MHSLRTLSLTLNVVFVVKDDCGINAAKKVLSMAPKALTFKSQLSNQPNFTGFAMSLLYSGETADIGDYDRYSLLNLVKYLEEFSGERTSSLKEHQMEISQMRAECERTVVEMKAVSTRRRRLPERDRKPCLG